ncbi:MAG: hypothetical protein AAF488_00880, partial [Planctomycetota bacterium]
HEAQFKEQVGDTIAGTLEIDVEELQRVFVELDHFEELFDHPILGDRSDLALDHDDALAAIWNYTPREELGGRRPIELFLREVVRAGEIDVEQDYGTKHVQCLHTGELLTQPDFFGPAFFAFVDGEDLHGHDMGPAHTRLKL